MLVDSLSVDLNGSVVVWLVPAIVIVTMMVGTVGLESDLTGGMMNSAYFY